jgi:hypothetical protein
VCTLEAIARALQYLGEPAELYATMLAPLQMIGQIQARFRQQSQAAPKANALDNRLLACAAPCRASAHAAGAVRVNGCDRLSHSNAAGARRAARQEPRPRAEADDAVTHRVQWQLTVQPCTSGNQAPLGSPFACRVPFAGLLGRP